MKFVDRDAFPPPSYFGSTIWSRYWGGIRTYFSQSDERIRQQRPPATVGAIADPDVRSSLASLFNGRCAFCERKVATEGHHFRPSVDASPKAKGRYAHVYYSWLCDVWENLYPICTDCAVGPPNYFPVAGRRAKIPSFQSFANSSSETAEYAAARRLYDITVKGETSQLLDPCFDRNLGKHLNFQLDGFVVPKGVRGQVTVERFHLNRPELVEERRSAFAVNVDRLLVWAASTAEGGPWEPLDDEAILGSWTLLWTRLRGEVAATIGKVAIKSDNGLFSALRKRSDRLQVIERVLGQPRSDADNMAAQIGTHRGMLAAPSIRRFAIADYKAIGRLVGTLPIEPRSLVPGEKVVAPCLLILGENSAGKSSVLEALALALVGPTLRKELALDRPSLLLNTAYLGKVGGRAKPRARINITFSDGSSRSLTIEKGDYAEQGETSRHIVLAYGPYRHFLTGADKPAPIRSLFQSDWVLANPEDWLLSLSPISFQDVVRTLRSILSIEGEFEVIERRSKECWMVLPIEGRPGLFSRAPLRVVSSGYRAVLAMACDILRQLADAQGNEPSFSYLTARATVLIDEVEAHLHPRWKLQIMEGLRVALPSVTFIVTSHDPLCLRGMLDDELIVLQRTPSDGEIPMIVESVTPLPALSKLTVEQLLTSDVFGLFSTDDPRAERLLAKVGDLMTKRADKTILPAEMTVLESFEADLSKALPIGGTEVHRLVQQAVEDFLSKRRSVAVAERNTLKDKAREKILAALDGIDAPRIA